MSALILTCSGNLLHILDSNNEPTVCFLGEKEVSTESAMWPYLVSVNFLLTKVVLLSQDIFYVENQKEYENKKAARKRRTQILGKKMKQAIKSLNFQEEDDTSRETFASDTNEALASLDEPQEGHGEAKLDAEEAIEVDHSHELDIF